MVYKHYFKHALFSKIVVLFYYFEESCISNILLDAPLVASGEKSNAFFTLTEIMPINSNIDYI